MTAVEKVVVDALMPHHYSEWDDGDELGKVVEQVMAGLRPVAAALIAAAREEDRAEIARLTGEMDEIRALLRAGRNVPAEFLFPDDEYWTALARKDGAS